MDINRDTILDKAIHDCFKEMYAKSQPMADYDNLLEEYKSGKIGKDERIYDRHYLSQEEFKYILKKYIDAYRCNKFWDEYIEILEEYLNEGGNKDKYIPEKIDEDGFKHPGYRSYESVPPLKVLIKNIIDEYFEHKELNQDRTELADDITNKVMEIIHNCKEYYNFDREEEQFSIAITLGASPTSNPETVKKWWKDNYNVDIEIEERNPLLFWEQDYYGDEFESVMEEEDGPNWKEIWDKKWKDELDNRKRITEEKLKEFYEKYPDLKI